MKSHSTRFGTAWLLLALCSVSSASMAPMPPDTILFVYVYDDQGGLLNDAVVSATTETSVIKGPWVNPHYFCPNAGRTTVAGIKTTLNVQHPVFGTETMDLLFIHDPIIRVDVVPDGAGGWDCFSAYFAPTNPPAPSSGSPPLNDLCDGATVLSIPDVVLGSTADATVDAGLPDCGLPVTAPGVWYRVTGTGNTMTASTCSNNSDFDTKLTVFCGSCAMLNCIAINDDTCALPGGSLRSTVNWCSDAGATYFILVHGFGDETGAFELSITDDGSPCDDPLRCLRLGACCQADGTCQAVSEFTCSEDDGIYEGDGTECFSEGESGFDYDVMPILAIPDSDPTGISSTLTVTDSFVVGDLNVTIDLDHTFVGELELGLSHNGTRITLVDRQGVPPGSGVGGCFEDDWNGIVLDDEGGGGDIENACAAGLTSPPHYTPHTALSAFDGMDVQGDWTLTVVDHLSLDTGVLNSWSITAVEAGAPLCQQPECFLVIGDGQGSALFIGALHEFTTQVGPKIDASYPVLMADIPEFVLPPKMRPGKSKKSGFGKKNGPIVPAAPDSFPAWFVDRKLTAQILLWNPDAFPNEPEQYSAGLQIEVLPDGSVVATPYGTGLGGIAMGYELDVNDDGEPVIRFPFAVAGL